MQTARALAQPAQFDPAAKRCRLMFAKINIARQQLGIAEDDYRQILFDETGELSLRKLDVIALEKVLARMVRLGFRALPKSGPKAGGKSPAAQHPMARKARALWISLHQLGVVHNPSEQALDAFARRQLGCDRLVWARQSDAFKLIEALKAMAERNGWSQAPEREGGKLLLPITLQQRLCEAILAKLKAADAVPVDWALHEVMWKLCGIENAREAPWTTEDYARLAKALGEQLRALAPAGSGDAE